MLDHEYINELKQLDNSEAKNALAEYANTFNVRLRKNKSFENMVTDLEAELAKLDEAPRPDETESGISTRELIDQFENQSEDTPNEDKIQLLVEDKTDDGAISEPLEAVQEELEVPSKEVLLDEEQEPGKDLEESVIQTEQESSGQYQLSDSFEPQFSLMGRDVKFYTLQYWILDWIESQDDWKSQKSFEQFPYSREIRTIETLLYYVIKDGSIVVRETRNSKYVTIK